MTTSDITPPPEARRPGGRTVAVLWGALLVSLIVNAFLIGGITAFVLRTQAGGGPVGSGIAGDFVYSPRFFWSSLDGSSRREIIRDLVGKRRLIRDLFGGASEARMNVLDTLKAEPFDPVAYSEALARVRAADLALRDEAAIIMVDIMSRLSEEERRAVVDLIEQRLHERAMRRPREGWLDGRDEEAPSGEEKAPRPDATP